MKKLTRSKGGVGIQAEINIIFGLLMYSFSILRLRPLYQSFLQCFENFLHWQGHRPLTGTQGLILYHIGHQKVSMQEIVKNHFGSNPAYHLRKLVFLNYVIVETHSVDARKLSIYLSEKGRHVYLGIQKFFEYHLQYLSLESITSLEKWQHWTEESAKWQKFWESPHSWQLFHLSLPQDGGKKNLRPFDSGKSDKPQETEMGVEEMGDALFPRNPRNPMRKPETVPHEASFQGLKSYSLAQTRKRFYRFSKDEILRQMLDSHRRQIPQNQEPFNPHSVEPKG